MNKLPVFFVIILAGYMQGISRNYDGIRATLKSGVSDPGDSTGLYLRSKTLLRSSAFPLTLFTAALLLNKSAYEREIQHDIHVFAGDDFNCSVDDYMQYLPAAQIYIGDIAGVEARNHWFDQSKNLLLTNILSAIATHAIKNLYSKSRPGGSPHSFPSGHTSLVFANATVLYHEYIASSPFLAYSGYGFAVTTAAMRILNDKHWISDVLAGAGIGILSANVVYLYEPLKNFNPFLKKTGNSTILFLPYYNNGAYGMSLISAF